MQFHYTLLTLHYFSSLFVPQATSERTNEPTSARNGYLYTTDEKNYNAIIMCWHFGLALSLHSHKQMLVLLLSFAPSLQKTISVDFIKSNRRLSRLPIVHIYSISSMKCSSRSSFHFGCLHSNDLVLASFILRRKQYCSWSPIAKCGNANKQIVCMRVYACALIKFSISQCSIFIECLQQKPIVIRWALTRFVRVESYRFMFA